MIFTFLLTMASIACFVIFVGGVSSIVFGKEIPLLPRLTEKRRTKRFRQTVLSLPSDDMQRMSQVASVLVENRYQGDFDEDDITACLILQRHGFACRNKFYRWNLTESGYRVYPEIRGMFREAREVHKLLGED